MLAVEIPEQPGSLKNLCELLQKRSLTEFSYRMGAGERAHIFMGVQVADLQDRSDLLNSLRSHGYDCLDLSDDELAKVHLRHMVGGRLPVRTDATSSQPKELLYRFEFPERPGALMRFVSALRADWSISIFHYRNHGADVGRIVVGVLVKPDELQDWQAVLRELGYASWEETSNPAYRIFLGA